MTSTTASQTFTMGERLPEELFFASSDDHARCRADDGLPSRDPATGYNCSRKPGHDGDHVATYSTREIVAIWPQATPEPQPEPEDEVTTYKRDVRAMAERKLRDGYGEYGTWNATLKRLGIEPLTKRTVRVVAPINRVSIELRNDMSEAQARDWLAQRTYNLETYLRPQREDLDLDGATVEVEEVAEVDEELDSEEDHRASTTDLDTFKGLVEEVARDLQSRHGWCDSGTEEVLRELGITSERDYIVWVTVTTNATQRVGIPVTAASEDDATQQVDRYSVADRVDSDEWQITGNSYSWDWEVDEVEED